MIKDVIIGIIQFIVLVFFQVLILDNISLWGFANPMVYVWFILMLPYNTARWLTLLSSFLLGMSIDVFSGQIGIHAFACTFLGFIRPVFLNMFSGSIENTSRRPCVARLGFVNFLSYSFILVFIHHFICFLIGIFTFSEIGQTLLRCIVSTLFTTVIILIADLIFFRKNE